MAEPTGSAAGVEGLDETVEGFETRRSELGELAERGDALRDEARELASRDLELSAERQEAHQQLRRLADELERLFRVHLAALDDEEARAARLFESLRERAAAFEERERGLLDRQERATAAEAELQESREQLGELRAELL